MEELNVLYEDNQIIVVIKPHNIPTQADDSKDKDLLSMVKEYVKVKYEKKGEAYIGMVQRLDRPTGGIVVFARTSKAANRLCEQLKDHTFHKTYYAIVDGVPKQKTGVLVNYLKKDSKTNKVTIVPALESGAKKAELEYKMLETNGKESLLEIQIKTGRSHQIRVQLSNIGLPICGDAKYNKNVKNFSNNMSLWAGKVNFVHPVSKDKLLFMVCPDTASTAWNKFYIDKYFTR